MLNHAKTFAQLLTQAIHRAASRQSQKIGTVQEELGYALGRFSGSVIEHWRKGHTPSRAADIETLARELVRRGGLENREQLREFLHSAGVPALLSLCDEFFPPSLAHPAILRLDRHIPLLDDRHLFGIEPLVEQVTRCLLDPEGQTLVVLDGLGGLGKTTVAQAAAARLAESEAFADVLWVCAKQTQLLPSGELLALDKPVLTFDELLAHLAAQLGRSDLSARSPQEREAALQTIFSTASYLIVIDNLETMTDYQTLIPRLRPLAGMSRFLITSRHSLRQSPGVQVCTVPALSRDDSLALLRHELERLARAPAPEAMLDAIYQAVGGLPLALKLLAAQLGHLPLSYVLDGLHVARGQSAEVLYTFIYRRTWSLLDERAKRLLMSMLLVSPEGEDLDWLRLVSALPDEEIEGALARLIDFSLVQVSGPLERPLYRMHRLTTTFLQADLLGQWHS